MRVPQTPVGRRGFDPFVNTPSGMMPPIDALGLVPATSAATASDSHATGQPPVSLPARRERGATRRGAESLFADAVAAFHSFLPHAGAMSFQTPEMGFQTPETGFATSQSTNTSRGTVRTAWMTAPAGELATPHQVKPAAGFGLAPGGLAGQLAAPRSAG